MTFASGVLFSQYKDYENRFNQENPVQRENNFRKAEVAEEIETRDQDVANLGSTGPGGPGEPNVPIDNAISFLAIIAIGLIIYQNKISKNTRT